MARERSTPKEQPLGRVTMRVVVVERRVQLTHRVVEQPPCRGKMRYPDWHQVPHLLLLQSMPLVLRPSCSTSALDSRLCIGFPDKWSS